MTNLLEKIKKQEFIKMFLLAIIVFIVLIVVGKIEFNGKIPEYVTHMGFKEEEQFIYYLKDSDLVEQEFISPNDFDRIGIHFSDHDQSISGKTFISIMNIETSEIIYSEEMDNSNIHYGEPVVLPISGEAGKPYLVSMHFEGMGEEGLGIFGFPIKKGESGASISGRKSDYRVAVATYTETNVFKSLIQKVYILMAVILVCAVFATMLTSWKEEYLFLSIALPVGAAFFLFLSINVVHDGGTHLAKVYHYSNVLLGIDEEDRYGQVSLKIDENRAFDEIYRSDHIENGMLTMYWETINLFGEEEGGNQRSLSCEYRETSASSFFEYFPGIIGMTIGRLFNGSAALNILLSKICFFIFYVLTIFFAIKIVPAFKMIFAFAGLLPMAMYQATGITYDSVVIAVCFLVTALLVKLRTESLEISENILLFLCAFIVGCCKGGFYLVILGVALGFIGNEEFKKKWKTFLLMLISGIAGLIFTSFNTYIPMLKNIFENNSMVKNVLEPEKAGAIIEMIPETNVSAYGIGYIFEDILGFIRLLIASITENLQKYVGETIGYRMAWSDQCVNWLIIFIFIFLLLMAASCTKTEKKIRINGYERVWIIILFGIEVIGLHVLMLIETPVGASIINGVQGRYFLPWIPLIMMCLYSEKRVYEENGKRQLFVAYAVAEVIYIYSFLKIFMGIL